MDCECAKDATSTTVSNSGEVRQLACPDRHLAVLCAEGTTDIADIDRVSGRGVGVDLRPGQRLEPRIVGIRRPGQSHTVSENQVVARAAADPVAARTADQ